MIALVAVIAKDTSRAFAFAWAHATLLYALAAKAGVAAPSVDPARIHAAPQKIGLYLSVPGPMQTFVVVEGVAVDA